MRLRQDPVVDHVELLHLFLDGFDKGDVLRRRSSEPPVRVVAQRIVLPVRPRYFRSNTTVSGVWPADVCAIPSCGLGRERRRRKDRRRIRQQSRAREHESAISSFLTSLLIGRRHGGRTARVQADLNERPDSVKSYAYGAGTGKRVLHN